MSTLQEERNRSSFNVLHMSEFLYGKQRLKKMDEVLALVKSDPVFDRGDTYYLDRQTLYTRTVEKNVQMLKRLDDWRHVLDTEEAVKLFRSYACAFEPLTGLHHSMFLPTVKSQMSVEQKEKWLPLAENYSILGTYAQTELGHGSNLKSIETTATYDKETQTFVLNTPHLTSMKWWPGGLGKSVTHAIIMARLIIDGKDLGFHSFICQIRSLEDHSVMPGITLGDIGPKFGIWNSIDNGRMELDNVSIPRENMLMGYSHVSPEGVYTKPPHSKLVYGTMIFVRTIITVGSAINLSKAITIAIRYSCVRRQGYLLGEVKKDELELKVLDYGSQQHSLFPVLADSYALWFASQYMTRIYDQLQIELADGEYSSLPEVHATACGLKAISTWVAATGIEESRQRCGGHGFLRSAGISDIYTGHLPSCTYEGDNLVLCQQTARYLIKCARLSQQQGKEILSNANYLNEALHNTNQVCEARSPEDLLDSEIQLAAFSALAREVVLNVYHLYEHQLTIGLSPKQAWNVVMPEFKVLTEAHSYLIIFKSFVDAVNNCEDSNLRSVLKSLCNLFALFNLEKLSNPLVLSGYLNKDQVFWIKENIFDLLQTIRQNAVPLVDAWHHDDFLLNSTLGKYDGDAYQALYDESKKSVLNKKDVLDTYGAYIRPLIKKAKI